jgi:ABC-type transport system substrate-binding protein
MSLRSRSLAIIGALSLVVVVGACSGGATPSPQPAAEAATCSALQAWSNEMKAFTSLDPATATADDVAAHRDAVATAWDAVQASLADVKASDKAAVEAGWAALEAALKNISKDVPVAEAINGVKAAAVPLKSAYKEMADGMGCAIATPY